MFVPLASTKLLDDKPSDEKKSPKKTSNKRVPLFIIFCGVFCLLSSETEGVVVDWGSLYMASLEGVSQAIAALTFGFFSLATAGCRLFCDRLRDNYGDQLIATVGGLLSSLGAVIVVTTPSAPFISLLGFALLGIGLSPIVPILYSTMEECFLFLRFSASLLSILHWQCLLFFPFFLVWSSQSDAACS